MTDSAPPTLPDLNSGPRTFITTQQDHGGIALVVCTLMATWVVLCFFIRVHMRATVSGPFGADDIMCSVATVFGVIQMIVSSVAISFGFGKALELLTDAQIVKVSKALYAAQLLYIVVNACTKCSVALLLARIVFIRNRVRACYAVLALSVIWGVASFLAEAIRCTNYAPWRLIGPHCTNMLLSWQVITAFNVFIEVLLFALPLWLVWGLRTDLSRKIVVASIFALRLPVIAAAITRVHFLQYTLDSAEPFFNGVVPFICLNIEMHYGLMAATMPTLKPFVGAFNTGWGTYDTTGVSGYGQHSHGSYVMASLGQNTNRSHRSGGNSRKGSHPVGGAQPDVPDHDPLQPNFGKNITHVQSATGRDSAGSDDSAQMIIRQTTTCEVHIESNERSRSRAEDSIELGRREPVSPTA